MTQETTPADSPAGSPSGPIVRQIPEGDNRERLVCTDCGFINYENPKIVVGAVCTWENKVLLCRRAIHPQRGLWTIPAGYMEQNETAEAGAAREAREEACAEIDIDGLIGVYTIPRISQVQLIYRAIVRDGAFDVGEETLELDLFDWDAIPWDEIAFPSVRWALDHWRELGDVDVWPPFSNPPGEDGNYPCT
jgi:ADP-ribose pyrophosphatase YjhB (NUDIX family)